MTKSRIPSMTQFRRAGIINSQDNVVYEGITFNQNMFRCHFVATFTLITNQGKGFFHSEWMYQYFMTYWKMIDNNVTLSVCATLTLLLFSSIWDLVAATVSITVTAPAPRRPGPAGTLVSMLFTSKRLTPLGVTFSNGRFEHCALSLAVELTPQTQGTHGY